MWSGAKGSRAAHEHLPRQARRASECVHLLMRQMHALAGTSGLYWAGLFSPADRLSPGPRVRTGR